MGNAEEVLGVGGQREIVQKQSKKLMRMTINSLECIDHYRCKVNYNAETKQLASRYSECYKGGGIHFDGMALRHTCFVWIL